MPLSDTYLDAIRRFEGFKPRPYWDVRQWTSGYGTRASGPGEVIGQAEADRRLRAELGSAQSQVRGLGVQMTPGQEAALTSLTFNAGPGWMNSGLGSAVRAGDWGTARNRFLQYVNANGQPLPGLQSRRAAEAAWLDQPAATPPAAPAPPTPAVAPQEAAMPMQPIAPFGMPPNRLRVPTLMQEAGEGGFPDLLSQFIPAPPQPVPDVFGGDWSLGRQAPPMAGKSGENLDQPFSTSVRPEIDADAIMRGAQAAAAARPQPPAGPGFLERLMGNPAFLAGLSILGTPPGGAWGPAGAQAAAQALRSRREQTEYERLQQRRSVMDRVWSEAFPNGQPNPQHPLMSGIAPEMAATIYAMGPEEGLPALQRFAFFRGQQAEQLRTLQARAQLAEEAGGGAQPAAALSVAAPPVQGAPGQAPAGGEVEPTVRFAGRTMTLGEAQARARRLDALGMRSELLEKTIADAVSGARPPEAVRTQALKVDQAYRSLSTSLDNYARLVERTGANILPGQEADAIQQSRTNIMLQLKELYNLGVLNGPDYMLMQQMLPDPSIGITGTGPGGMVPSISGLPNLVPGNASARVTAGVRRLKELLRDVRNSQPGLPPVQAPQSNDSGYRVLGVR